MKFRIESALGRIEYERYPSDDPDVKVSMDPQEIYDDAIDVLFPNTVWDETVDKVIKTPSATPVYDAVLEGGSPVSTQEFAVGDRVLVINDEAEYGIEGRAGTIKDYAFDLYTLEVDGDEAKLPYQLFGSELELIPTEVAAMPTFGSGDSVLVKDGTKTDSHQVYGLAGTVVKHSGPSGERPGIDRFLVDFSGDDNLDLKLTNGLSWFHVDEDALTHHNHTVH